MCPIKITIVVNEGLWDRFKEFVFQRYGSYRELSEAIEESIKIMEPIGLMMKFVKLMGIFDAFPSSCEIVERRSSIDTSAGQVVREMRNGREERLFGFKRDS
ncbi:MAG: hypothetical protein ACTSV7_11265 [Candidatus Baldrarchaeia archaeon]